MFHRYKSSKYKAKKTVIDGIVFDSKLEAEYYVYLKTLKKLGKIQGFDRQMKYELIPSYKQKDTNKTVRGVSYIVDFVVYYNDNTVAFIDTKGYETADFKIKKKLFETKYQVRLLLVKRNGRSFKVE